MAGKIWTAEELEAMTPAQQDEIFEASLVRDLKQVPSEFLGRVRSRLRARIAAAETGER